MGVRFHKLRILDTNFILPSNATTRLVVGAHASQDLLMEKGVWDLVELPPEANLTDGHWTYSDAQIKSTPPDLETQRLNPSPLP